MPFLATILMGSMNLIWIEVVGQNKVFTIHPTMYRNFAIDSIL